MWQTWALCSESAQVCPEPTIQNRCPQAGISGLRNCINLERQTADSYLMHSTQAQSTMKGRIHILKARSEVPALDRDNDQRGAWPFPEEKGKAEIRGSKPSTPSNGPSRLDRFAREHGLVVEIEEYPDAVSEDVHRVPRICLQDAFITDPIVDPFVANILGSKKAVKQALQESKVRSPLQLILTSEQIDRLKEAIKFDLPTYGYECNALREDPNSSNWGGILHRTGVRYLYGCDEGISLLFSSRDGAAMTLALALARIR